MFAISGIAPMEFLALWSASSTVCSRLAGVANAASGEAGWIAPGQLVVLRGAGWARCPRVLLDGIAACRHPG